MIFEWCLNRKELSWRWNNLSLSISEISWTCTLPIICIKHDLIVSPLSVVQVQERSSGMCLYIYVAMRFFPSESLFIKNTRLRNCRLFCWSMWAVHLQSEQTANCWPFLESLPWKVVAVVMLTSQGFSKYNLFINFGNLNITNPSYVNDSS